MAGLDVFAIRFEFGSSAFTGVEHRCRQAGSVTITAPTIPTSFVPWIEQ
jgi:hypothetical protein